MHLMVIVINDVKKVKPIINQLQELGIKGATVIDSMGTSNYHNKFLESRTNIGNSLKTVTESTNYNKTIFSVVHCEKHLLEALETVGNLLDFDKNKTNKGIIFSIPVYKSKGGALERSLKDNSK